MFAMFRKKKYEASIYFMRELTEPPKREDDLPYFLIRLHDIYISKRNIKSVMEYVKEYIRVPRRDDGGVWVDVLTKYGIPCATLLWETDIIDLEPKSEKSVFKLRSQIFHHNGLACQLYIKVYCEHKETLSRFLVPNPYILPLPFRRKKTLNVNS